MAFSWLWSAQNVPRQQYINAGYFTVKEVVLDDENGYQIRLTPQLTGKGQQWLTRKLLDAGLLKPVAKVNKRKKPASKLAGF
ncbi:phage antirepressor KilAC domain protein, partial (plasmid) [Escherichia coli]